MKNYINLLKDIKENGVRKPSRAGDTLSVFGRQLRWNMEHGFPLMTIKKVSFHNIAHELLWFLGAFDEEWKKFGNTNIRYLVDHNVNIWNADAYRGYVQEMQRGKHGNWIEQEEFIQKIKEDDDFALKWGELGDGIYGGNWKYWDGESTLGRDINFNITRRLKKCKVNQIHKVIDQIKSNPLSRRHLVTAWNPSTVDDATLPPCHYGFTLNCQPMSYDERFNYAEKLLGFDPYTTIISEDALDSQGIPKYHLSLKWNQRSVDTPLGLPYNIASYALLLHMLAYMTNTVPKDLIGSLEDVHYYTNQQEAVDELISREGSEPQLPTIKLVNTGNIERIEDFRIDNFEINGYNPLSKVKAPLSVGL